MADYMDKKGLEDLASRLIDAFPANLLNPESFLKHLIGTYYIAEETTALIKGNYPSISTNLNIKQIAIAAGLHDIGRPLRKDQAFHELRGAVYVLTQGMRLGIASNEKALKMIATIFTPHYVVAEQFENAIPEELHEFKDLKVDKNRTFNMSNGIRRINTRDLKPRALEQKIVVYSELSNDNGEPMGFETRINDVIERYKPGTEYYKNNPKLGKAMERGLPRVREICKEIRDLTEEKIPQPRIITINQNI